MRINTVTVSGNIVRDPEGKTLPNDNYVCRVSIAHNDRQKIKGEWEDVVSYFDAVVWGKMGEIVEKQGRKGMPIVITGALRQERWETDSGEKRSAVKINATGIVFGKPKPKDGDRDDQGAPRPVADDDVPW